MRLNEAQVQAENDFQSSPKALRLSEAMSTERHDLIRRFAPEMPDLFPGEVNEQGDTVYDTNQVLSTLQREQGKMFPEAQAFEQGVLPLGKTAEERTKLAQEHPIATAVGQVAGLIGVGTVTGGIGPAVTSSRAVAALPTLLRVAAGRVAATGAQFGIKELADQAAEIVSGDKKSFNDVLGAVVSQSAFGAGFGAVGVISSPLARIPAEAAYGYVTAKVMGATNLEAGVNGALFAVLGAFNLKNYNTNYAKQAAAGARRAFIDKMVKVGAKPEAAEMAANRYFNYLEKVLVETKGGKFRTLNVSDYDAIAAKMREPWKQYVEPVLPPEALPGANVKPGEAVTPAEQPLLKPDPTQPVSVDPLITEAKKYKSAEEFINSRKILYHGTDKNFEVFDAKLLGKYTGAESAKEGFFFTDNKRNAEMYAGIKESEYNKYSDEYKHTLDKIANIVNIKKVNKEFNMYNLGNAINEMDSEILREERLVLEEFSKATNWEADTIEELASFTPNTDAEKAIFDKAKEIINKAKFLESKYAEYKNLKNNLFELGTLLDSINLKKDVYAKEKGIEDKLEGWGRTFFEAKDVEPNVKEVSLDIKNPYEYTEPLDTSTIEGISSKKTISEIVEYAKENGYDSAIIKGKDDPLKGTIYVVFSPDQIKTKSQLTDIWNRAHAQAHGIIPQQPPTQMTIVDPVLEAANKRIENIKKAIQVEGMTSSTGLATYKSAVKKLVNDIGKTDDNKTKLLLAKILPANDKLTLINNIDSATDVKGINGILSSLQNKLSVSGLRAQVRSNIADKRIKNIDNLRKMRRLPTIDNMHPDQLKMFDYEVSQFQEGDVLLTQRQLETVDKTDLKGIKTLREAREMLAKQAGVSVESLQNIKVSELDRFRYDTDLATRNPLYKIMVEETRKNILESEKRFLDIENKINELTIKARKSRKQSLGGKLVPTDKVVFSWLEADDNGKVELSKSMTKEETNLAEYLQGQFAESLKYLISTKALETGRANYITHIRRGFVEALKEDGFGAAIQEILDQQKLDAQTFNILDQATDEILPLEKFFRFTMQRTGGLKPSQNVAKAASVYFRTFEKKKALDAIIPKLTIYAQAITPERLTAKGLEFDQSVKKFINEWVNTKKGRPAKLFMKPGGKIDVAVKSLKAFLTIKDLGLNLAVGVSSGVGESVASYVSLGKGKIAIALARRFTPKGKRILKKYENFVGKGVFEELAEPSKDISDKMIESLFSLFKANSVELNKIHLLGSMSKEEFEAEELSPLALAEMQIDMGRLRVIEASKSILGSTTEGGLFTQYKSWAVPILTTTAKDISSVVKDFSKGGFGKANKTREFKELVRMLEITTAALIVGSFMVKDEDDDSFGNKVLQKAYRESLTIMGALDAKMLLSVPRLLTWVANLGDSVSLIVKMEKYKDWKRAGDLKGVEKLKRELMPKIIEQFMKKDDKKRSKGVKW